MIGQTFIFVSWFSLFLGHNSHKGAVNTEPGTQLESWLCWQKVHKEANKFEQGHYCDAKALKYFTKNRCFYIRITSCKWG